MVVPIGSHETQATRQNAESLLRDMVKRLRRKADGLETLADFLPDPLNEDVEKALWTILIDYRV